MLFRYRSATVRSVMLAICGLMAAPSATVFAQPPQVTVEPEQAFAKFVRTQWVLLDEKNGINGAIGTFDLITGRLNPMASMRLRIYDARAALVKRITTGPAGRFRIDDLPAGLYQCIADGDRGVLAFSLFAIQRGDSTSRGAPAVTTRLVQAPLQTADRLEIFSAAVPPTFTQLNAVLRLYYGRTTPDYFGGSSVSATTATRAAHRPADGECRRW